MNKQDWQLVDLLLDHAIDLDEDDLESQGASLERIRSFVAQKINEASEPRPVVASREWNDSGCVIESDWEASWDPSDC